MMPDHFNLGMPDIFPTQSSPWAQPRGDGGPIVFKHEVLVLVLWFLLIVTWNILSFNCYQFGYVERTRYPYFVFTSISNS